MPAVPRLRRSPSLGLLTALVAGPTVVVWYGLILERWAGNPIGLAAWLGLLGASSIALRHRLRAARGVGRDPLMDGPAMALTAFGILLVLVFQYGHVGVLSDARDYFVQVRSLVIDRDLHITGDEVARMAARGDALYYPIGSALLWAPFFAACHASLGVLNLIGADHVRDGYGQPYAIAVGLGTLVYGFGALLLIVRVLRTYFSAWLSVIAAMGVYAGSFVGWYLTIEPVMTHGTSLFAVTLFLSLWHEWRDARHIGHWIALGAAAGLMAIVRWQEALFAVVLAADALRDYWRIWRHRAADTWLPTLGRHAAGVAAVIVLLVPQLWLWQAQRVNAATLAADEFPFRPISDAFSLRSLIRDEFRLRRWDPELENVLFSPNHGLFTWTPIVYVALVGLVPFVRRAPRFTALLVAGFVAQVYVNGLLQVWWGGSGFGARRFAGCALVFAVGLASAIEWLRSRPRMAVACLLLPFLFVNTTLMLEIHEGRLPNGEGLTAGDLLSGAYRRVGNPFSFPANWIFSRMHRGETPATYDELGRRTYRLARVDVGHEDDDPFVTYGWADREQVYDVSFRWAVGREAGLALPFREAPTATLRFTADPFYYDGAPPQTIEVILNGTSLATLPMDFAWREYTVDVPGRVLSRNLNHLAFRFASAMSPLALGVSSDDRELAVRFDYVELRRDRSDDFRPRE